MAKIKFVKRSWLSEAQARDFVAAANTHNPVRFSGRCWEIVVDPTRTGGAMTEFRLRQLPDERCPDLDA